MAMIKMLKHSPEVSLGTNAAKELPPCSMLTLNVKNHRFFRGLVRSGHAGLEKIDRIHYFSQTVCPKLMCTVKNFRGRHIRT